MKHKKLIIFIVLSVFASGLNYALYPFMSRVLTSSEYVDITVALTLFTQISTFLSSIIAITIGISKRETKESGKRTIELLQANIFKLFLALSLIFLASAPLTMQWLHTPAIYALPVCLMMLFSIPFLVVSGYFNGKNELVKLGLITALSAFAQFSIALSVALTSHNGPLTMLSMTIAQLITIALVYVLFRGTELPNPVKSFFAPNHPHESKRIRKILIYSSFAAIAITMINIVQVIDLAVVQKLQTTNTKFYTDIYVISRIVFFAGTIFIWPFLGELNVLEPRKNRLPFYKLMMIFGAIFISTCVAIFLFADMATGILFGVQYPNEMLHVTAILSVTYKYLLLIISALILYFVVMNRLAALWLSFAFSSLVIFYSFLVNVSWALVPVLTTLNIFAAVAATAGVTLFIRSTRS